jgi:hypothetical protein
MPTNAHLSGLSPRSALPAAPPDRPRGELAARTLAMPTETDPAGDIFGGRPPPIPRGLPAEVCHVG